MRLSTTIFSKPWAPCCLARKISAVPPSAILRKIVYRDCRLIRSGLGCQVSTAVPLDDRRSSGQVCLEAGRRGAPTMRARTVLLVEDDLDIRDVLQDVLES